VKQFDVYRTRQGDLVCILQHRFLLDRATVMVCLVTRTDDAAVKGLTPAVTIEDHRHLLDVTTQIPVKASSLRGLELVATLEDQRDEVLNAINMLYWGI